LSHGLHYFHCQPSFCNLSSIIPLSWYLNGSQSFTQLTFKSEEVKSHPGMYS
jgi:hypothetical protein